MNEEESGYAIVPLHKEKYDEGMACTQVELGESSLEFVKETVNHFLNSELEYLNGLLSKSENCHDQNLKLLYLNSIKSILSTVKGREKLVVANDMITLIYKDICSVHWKSVQASLLRLYVLLQLVKYSILFENFYSSITQRDEAQKTIENSLYAMYECLDMSLIVAHGSDWRWFIKDRLKELNYIVDNLSRQHTYLKPIPFITQDAMKDRDRMESGCLCNDAAGASVSNLMDRIRFSPNSPSFCTKGVIEFKAIKEWNNLNFWKRYRFRMVPIEIGQKYTSLDWTIKNMTMQCFLENYIMKKDNDSNESSSSIAYLAQHDILSQMNDLKQYLSLSVFHDIPPSLRTLPRNQYRIWFGTRGTVTPFHTDPYQNLFMQLVGDKKVYLIHPQYSELMNVCEDPLLKNTCKEEDIQILKNTPGLVMEEFLMQPGDILFIPKGWWHHLTAQTISISLSLWF